MMQKATRTQTKDHNTNLVLKTIIDTASISRAEIARTTGLTRTTVSDIVADLLVEGLVKEIGVGSSIGGKSPILLSLEPNSRFLIGLDLARNKFTGAIVNLRGEIRLKVEQEVIGVDGEAALNLLYEMLDQLVGTDYLPIVGIGIGAPGLVNANDGVVVSAVNLDWKDLPLARLVQARYHLPVEVFNDSQAAAIGEYTFGEGHTPEGSLVVINVRYGVGAGIIINGQLFHGDGGGAGEIGHIVVVPQGGQPCRCGKTGCLETVASSHALIEKVQRLVAEGQAASLARASGPVSLETIESAFRSGDAAAAEVVREAGHYLGVAISNLVGTLNIHQIVLAGDMTCFGEAWLLEIRQTMAANTLERLAEATQVEIGKLGPNGIILGASAMILQNYSLLFSGSRRPEMPSGAAA